MRYNEIIPNNALEEAINRRDFLKGLGAAAGVSTLGLQAYKQGQNQSVGTSQNNTQNAATTATSVQNRPDMATPVNQTKSAPTAAPQPQKVIPEYSPQQLEKYIIDYARKYLPIDQAIQFLAQVKTETHDFRSLEEYDAPGHANYEGGAKYKGRGYLQLTHLTNYDKYGRMIGQDLVNDPELLLYPNIAAQASVAYWKDYAWPTSQRIMKKYGERFKSLPKAITRVVNGGYNKLDERKKNVDYYTRMFKGEAIKQGKTKIVPKKKSR